jgi:hypothetical protein
LKVFPITIEKTESLFSVLRIGRLPEVLLKLQGKDSPKIDLAKADVFSLGMTLLGLLSFNPYLVLDPEIEYKYPTPFLQMERILHLQEDYFTEITKIIENYLKKEQKWTFELQEKYDIHLFQHEEFLKGMILILKKVITFQPEERLEILSLSQQLKILFMTAFGISIDDFLEKSGKFFS